MVQVIGADLLILLWDLGWIMERGAEETDALVLFKNSLQASVREVQVDLRAFKEQVEQKLEELSVSSRPLAAAVSRLQEENLQLREKLEALSGLVEALTGAKVENGQTQSREQAGGGAGAPAPPPWRTRRQAEANVSIHPSSWKPSHLRHYQ